MRSDEQAIRNLHATWMEALNGRDLDCLLGLMTDDVVLFNPGRAPMNRNDFPGVFLPAHEKFQIRCISALQEVVVTGNVAYTLSRDSLDLTPRSGGETIRLAGERMTIYRKQSDGRWLLARDIHTLSPVQV